MNTAFSEKDIQTAIKYLKTIDPKRATREDAIMWLENQKLTAHFGVNHSDGEDF